MTENGRRDVPAPLNERVLARNRIARELAEEKGLFYNDLYALVEGKPELRSDDGFHYNGEGYEVLADGLAGIFLGAERTGRDGI